MSEEVKKPRLFTVIQQEYMQLCTRAGDLQFKADSIKKDLDLLNQQMRDLGLEAVQAQQAEAEAKKKAAAEEAAKAAAPAAEAPKTEVPANG